MIKLTDLRPIAKRGTNGYYIFFFNEHGNLCDEEFGSKTDAIAFAYKAEKLWGGRLRDDDSITRVALFHDGELIEDWKALDYTPAS